MPGQMTFNITLEEFNKENIPEMAGRAKDLRMVYGDIIDAWLDANQDKFDSSIGGELSGVEVDPGVFWQPLAESTIQRKRKLGLKDQIMVETGQLEAALTSSDMVFQYVTETEAKFGSPQAPEEMLKVRYNWLKRQTIFLSLGDQDMIRKKVFDYLTLGPDYKDIQFAKGLKNKRAMDSFTTEFPEANGDFDS